MRLAAGILVLLIDGTLKMDLNLLQKWENTHGAPISPGETEEDGKVRWSPGALLQTPTVPLETKPRALIN